jgi:hypothetical protein
MSAKAVFNRPAVRRSSSARFREQTPRRPGPRPHQASRSAPGNWRADWGDEPVTAAELGADIAAVFTKSFA